MVGNQHPGGEDQKPFKIMTLELNPWWLIKCKFPGIPGVNFCLGIVREST